jgi:hypothetical protein
MRPIIKLIRNLMPAIIPFAAIQQGGRLTIRRSIDDKAIPYIRSMNKPRALNGAFNVRTKITALVFIKTIGKQPTVIPPENKISFGIWKIKRPFWNTTRIKNLLWWKFMGKVSLTQAKRIIAREMMDYLYKLIYVEHLPVIAVRVVLVDWNTGLPVDPGVLRDAWFSSTGFNDFKVDSLTLKTWGIRIGQPEKDTHQTSVYKFFNDNRFDKNQLDDNEISKMFNIYNIDIPSLISFVLVNTSSKLSFTVDNKTRILITNKLKSIVRNNNFKTEIQNFIMKKLKNDKQFRESFVKADNKKPIIREAITTIINAYIDQEITNQA